MQTTKIDIRTADGICDAFAAFPKSGGPHPALLFYMDAYGPRPWLEEMATTLAAKGYFVVLPNMFYRKGRAPLLKLKFPMKAEDRESAMEQIMPLLKSLTPDMAMSDAAAIFDFLGTRKEVRPGKIGITGYCMGGALAVRTAARFPDRVAAAASFHGGRLATDADDSPHRSLGRVQAELYFAHADNDQSMPPEQISRLATALDEAGVKYEAELYAGAVHGFTMRDLPPFNEEALQRHWTKLFALLGRKLGRRDSTQIR